MKISSTSNQEKSIKGYPAEPGVSIGDYCLYWRQISRKKDDDMAQLCSKEFLKSRIKVFFS